MSYSMLGSTVFVPFRYLLLLVTMSRSNPLDSRQRGVLAANGFISDLEDSKWSQAVSQLQLKCMSATGAPLWRERWWMLSAHAKLHWELCTCTAPQKEVAEIRDLVFSQQGAKASAQALGVAQKMRNMKVKLLVPAVRDVVVWKCVLSNCVNREDALLAELDKAFEGRLLIDTDLKSQLLNSFHHIFGKLPFAFSSANASPKSRASRKKRANCKHLGEPMSVSLPASTVTISTDIENDVTCITTPAKVVYYPSVSDVMEGNIVHFNDVAKVPSSSLTVFEKMEVDKIRFLGSASAIKTCPQSVPSAER